MDFNFFKILIKNIFDMGINILTVVSSFSRNSRQLILYGKCKVRKYYSGEAAFVDKRIYFNTESNVIFPFVKACQIKCTDADEQLVNFSDSVYQNIINFGICKSTYDNNILPLPEIIRFCLLPKKTIQMVVTFYPWENIDPMVISNQYPFKLD